LSGAPQKCFQSGPELAKAGPGAYSQAGAPGITRPLHVTACHVYDIIYTLLQKYQVMAKLLNQLISKGFQGSK